MSHETEGPATTDWVGKSGEKERIPMMLKVLTGRHAGASMRLQSRQYTIGREEMCDFIFLDDGFAKGSLTLDLTGEKPTLSAPEGMQVLVGAQPMLRESIVLGRYEAVSVGGTRFAIGPADEPWPEMDGSAETAAQPQAQPSDEKTQTISADPGHFPPQSPDSPYLTPPPPDKSARPFYQRYDKIIAIAALLAFIGGVAFFTEPDKPKEPDLKVRVGMVIAELKVPDLKIIADSVGLCVLGQVATDSLRNLLTARLGALAPPVSARLLSAERIALNAQDILEMYHMELSVRVRTRGRVVLYGVYDDRNRMHGILESLKQEVAGVSSIEDSVQSTASIYPYLSEILTKETLSQKVRFEADKGRLYGLLIQGKMSKADLAAWERVKKSAASAYGLDVQERWTDKLSPALLKTASAWMELDTDLMAVGVGTLNYLTMRNGKKYFEGTRLSTGHIIRAIQKDRIILESDGVQDTYYLQGGSNERQ